jgi:hypothetical protein
LTVSDSCCIGDPWNIPIIRWNIALVSHDDILANMLGSVRFSFLNGCCHRIGKVLFRRFRLLLLEEAKHGRSVTPVI